MPRLKNIFSNAANGAILLMATAGASWLTYKSLLLCYQAVATGEDSAIIMLSPFALTALCAYISYKAAKGAHVFLQDAWQDMRASKPAGKIPPSAQP